MNESDLEGNDLSIELHLTDEQLLAIEMAAALCLMSVEDFIIDAATSQAILDIARHEREQLGHLVNAGAPPAPSDPIARL